MATSKGQGEARIVGHGAYFVGFQNQASSNQSEVGENPTAWGFSVLETSEAQDTDKDSLLLLRQLLLSHISNMRYKGPGLPWCFFGTSRRSQVVLDESQCRSMLYHVADSSCSGMDYGDGPYLDTL